MIKLTLFVLILALAYAALVTLLIPIPRQQPLPHIPYCMTPIGMAFPCREIKGFWRSA